MQSNTRTDTRPEVALRSALHQLGLRFRKDYRVETDDLIVRVDVAFPKRRVAVFLDGCYWHACPEHGHVPKTNSEFWAAKFRRNVARDREVNRALRSAGWKVVRIWEHVPISEEAASLRELLAHSQTGANGV